MILFVATNWVKQSNNPIRIPNKFSGILTALEASVFIVCRKVGIQRFECQRNTVPIERSKRENLCHSLFSGRYLGWVREWWEILESNQ